MRKTDQSRASILTCLEKAQLSAEQKACFASLIPEQQTEYAETPDHERDLLRGQNFARTREVLAENCFMTKRALAGVAGFLSLGLSLSAQQQTEAPNFFSALDS